MQVVVTELPENNEDCLFYRYNNATRLGECKLSEKSCDTCPKRCIYLSKQED